MKKQKEQTLSELRNKIKKRIDNNNCSQGCKTKMLVILMEVISQDKEFIKKLLEYQDTKIKLSKGCNFITPEELEAHITCCLDTKIFIKQLVGKKYK